MPTGRQIKKQKKSSLTYDESQTITKDGKRCNATCIFCKIVSGEATCYKLYEDDQVMAFLDINPLHKGHTLVIPKEHYEQLDKVPGNLASACMSIIPMISNALMKATNTQAWNIMQNNGRTAGQEVFHVHFHIIPRSTGDYMSKSWCKWNVDKLGTRSIEEESFLLEQHDPATLVKEIEEAMKPNKNGKEEM